MAAGPRPYRGLVRARRVLRGRRLNCQRRGRRWSRAAHAGCVLGCLPVLLLLPALLVLEQPEVRDAPRRRWWDGSWEFAVVLRRRHFLHKTKAAISKTRKARAQKASTHESTHKRRTKARQKAQKAEKHEKCRCAAVIRAQSVSLAFGSLVFKLPESTWSGVVVDESRWVLDVAVTRRS